ncbi:hypothetical protein Tco_1013568, partial [Tanacetum coccineum]
VVDNKPVDIVDIEKLGKDLENASLLEIMDRALEKYGNVIAMDFRYPGAINSILSKSHLEIVQISAPVSDTRDIDENQKNKVIEKIHEFEVAMPTS